MESFEPDVTDRNYNEVLGVNDIEPTFIDDNERAMFVEAKMGEEVMMFLNSDPGRMVRSLIKGDVVAAREALTHVPPWRRRKIQALQNRVHQGTTILGYLSELIQRGESAYIQLHQGTDYEH